jgi:ferrous iron transport protein A
VSHSPTNLAELGLGDIATIEHVGGERAFRRRIMELGLVPGTRVELVAVAPLGDPLELLVRGASLSIRRADAAEVRVARGLEPVLHSAESGESATALSRALVRGAS